MTTPVREVGSSGTPVGSRENDRRWYALRYLRACTYPATVAEIAEYVGPRVGSGPEAAERALRRRDLPALSRCETIEFDPGSDLACLDDREPFADRVRRAIAADALTHLKPPRLKRNDRGVFY
ncbi:hypothetical protein [Halalkalicoccus sp. NIPERK01]|uniref:hypothetical protein n=1 Tax=Halalkalicoccus sp. NIPERK01 TaxID=3053469 RepID=UPI00256F39DE|nr:hypothetical protein [Halalkalicoccus sp. NIPERK01]MDL5363293.1 hypothetical protein [Halalkalicoccus sp. NIPERK01]